MMPEKETAVQVFDIERFAIHDGPGIRTTVFLQGCPLRCAWCANPESWTLGPKLFQFRNRCVGCGRCVQACPQKAIVLSGNVAQIDRDKCDNCGVCAKACPYDALRISGKIMTVRQIVDIVLRDRDYYETSGGGVTISGGEPLFQFDAFLELLKELKREGLHTAVETAGQIRAEQFRTAEKWIDLYLFDLKHTDAGELRCRTQGNLDMIMDNLSWIAQRRPQKVVLRVPVIPGFNNSEKDITAIFETARRLGIQSVHLLPYHTLGASKHEQTGIPYRYACYNKMMDIRLLESLAKLGVGMGLKVRAG